MEHREGNNEDVREPVIVVSDVHLVKDGVTIEWQEEQTGF